jgi:transcriptional regulator with XRE-family HTH domain
VAPLIERLRAWQAIEGLSDAELADLLGVKEQMFRHLMEGTYRLSKRSLARIAIRLPGLEPLILAYIKEEVDLSSVEQAQVAA